jgi:ribosome biogenesis ATPase
VANDPRCEGFSGADLASLIRESAVASLRARFYASGIMDVKTNAAEDIFVTKEHFDAAFSKVSPSVLPQDKLSFDKLRKKYG